MLNFFGDFELSFGLFTDRSYDFFIDLCRPLRFGLFEFFAKGEGDKAKLIFDGNGEAGGGWLELAYLMTGMPLNLALISGGTF